MTKHVQELLPLGTFPVAFIINLVAQVHLEDFIGAEEAHSFDRIDSELKQYFPMIQPENSVSTHEWGKYALLLDVDGHSTSEKMPQRLMSGSLTVMQVWHVDSQLAWRTYMHVSVYRAVLLCCMLSNTSRVCESEMHL